MDSERELGKYKIVTIGGGTGHFALLDGLKQVNDPNLITAIPHTVDDGGSSGQLIAEFGVLPPGDARQCALALAPQVRQRTLADKFNFRFPEGNGEARLAGHNVGNILISALEYIHGSPETAMADFLETFQIPGRVIPVSNKRSRLVAIPTEGEPIVGESEIDKRAEKPGYDPRNRIVRVMLENELVMNPNVGKAIEAADILIVAPGDLYTSKIPPFLTGGFVDAWHSSRAMKVYCGDLMTKKGETDNMSALNIFQTFFRYLEVDDLDLILLNNHRKLPRDVVKLYQQHGQKPIKADICEATLNGTLKEENLAKAVYPRVYNPKAPRVVLRHNSLLLAETIVTYRSLSVELLDRLEGRKSHLVAVRR